MAFIVEKTFTRPDVTTPWPWDEFPVDKRAELEALRSSNNVTMENSMSADGLVATYTDSCASADEYAEYFTDANAIWTAGGLFTSATNNNVVINHTVLEDT